MKHLLFFLSPAAVVLVCAVSFAQSTSQPNATSVTGSGTTQFVPIWVAPTKIGNSTIFETKTKQVGIGTQTPAAALDVTPASLVLSIFARGANAPLGSGQNGADGLHATGGAGDGDGPFGGDGLHAMGGGGTGGGAGIIAAGGSGFMGPGSDGPGLVAIGGGASGDGVDGNAPASCPTCLAGNFAGNVMITGTLTAATKNFRIDHPLDPANKYLVHSSVESSEMKNFYDGDVVLNKNGEAVVQLPDWFEAANGSLRYQLTAIGVPSPGLYVAQKVTGNRFKIAGGTPGGEVSWQITGVRQDRFAKANPMVVEPAKSDKERGYYIHPELYGAPEEKGIEWARHPQLMQQLHQKEAEQLAAERNPQNAGASN